MVIEIKQEKIVVQGEQRFSVIVDGETVHSNLTYEELITITIGDLDKVEEEEE